MVSDEVRKVSALRAYCCLNALASIVWFRTAILDFPLEPIFVAFFAASVPLLLPFPHSRPRQSPFYTIFYHQEWPERPFWLELMIIPNSTLKNT